MYRGSIGLVLAMLAAALCFGVEPVTKPDESKPAWSEQFYNPKPAAGDLVLPMPCGGAMVFRPIEVPSTHWLDDLPFELGQPDDPRVGYKEGRRSGYIAGAFTDRDNHTRRYYYLAKYETTRDQYAALNGQCPQPSMQGSVPVDDISWFDAVNFARRYTEWLLQNALAQLPIEGEQTDFQTGFLRLPTEEEWEFAARGGLRVTKTQFLDKVFPIKGELEQYAWYQGPAKGRLHPVGSLEPNPLGLYDILGNVAEMVFLPFQLDRRGRLHGQAGGFVAKGGDILMSRDQLRTAVRDELPYFDRQRVKATSLRHLGFRLVLTTPVIVSPERLHEIQEEWIQLPTLMGTAGQQASQALASLNNLTQETKDDKLRVRLESVEHELEKAHAEINATRDRAVGALIRMGTFLGNKVKTDAVRLSSIEELLKLARDDYQNLYKRVRGLPDTKQILILREPKAQIASMEKDRDTVLNSLENSLSYYGDMVIVVADDYSKEVVEPQLEKLKVEFKTKQSEYLIFYASLFVNHIKAYQQLKKADMAEWRNQILDNRGGQP